MRIDIIQILNKITQGHAVIQHSLGIILPRTAPLALHACDRNQSEIPNAPKHKTELPAM